MPEDNLVKSLRRLDLVKKKSTKPVEDNTPPFLTHLNIGFYLILPILLGVYIGYLIDNKLNTKPIFILVFLLLGVVSSFYNLWRLTKEK